MTATNQIQAWIDEILRGKDRHDLLPDLFVSNWFASADPHGREGWPVTECVELFLSLSEHIGGRWPGRFSLAMGMEDSDSLRTTMPEEDELRSARVDPDLYFFEPQYFVIGVDRAERFASGRASLDGVNRASGHAVVF